jgi:hypothetical protein
MRQLLILGALLMFTTVGHSQKKKDNLSYGLSSGVMSVSSKTDTNISSDNTVKDSFTGFYIGGFADYILSESLSIQGELLLGNVNSSSSLLVPVQAKIKFLPKLSFLVGVQANYNLKEERSSFNSFAVDGIGGITFNITRDFFVLGRYAVPLMDKAKEDVFSLKSNILNIGIGYTFK